MNASTKRLKILVAGVGGQGALTAARFLGDAAMAVNLPVIVGQLHGMSQRGGAVECSVIIGDGHSSHIGDGEADVVMGLEPLEAKRSLPKMSQHTKCVVNLGKIVPFSLAMRGESYPELEPILAYIRTVTPHLYTVDGPALVRQTGISRTLNVAMLGAVAGLDMLPFGHEVLWQAIEKKIPPRFLEVNRQAFDLGVSSVNQ